MARAPALKLDPQDFQIACEYLVNQLPAAMGVTVEFVPPFMALRNPKTEAIYNVMLCAGLKNNEFVIQIYPNGRVINGEVNASWIAVLLADTSTLCLIPTKELMGYVSHAATNENKFQGMRFEPGDVLNVYLNYGWALEVKLIHKVVKLKGDPFLRHRGVSLCTSEQFVHLHAHSYFSLLDGVAPPAALVEQAKLNGQPAIALTDHGSMFGTYKFWQAGKEHGIKTLLGVEAYMVDNDRLKDRYKDSRGTFRRFEYHQTLIAMNQQGWENLCELMSLGSRENFYYVPRISHEMLFKYSEGLIVLSGCFKGMVAHHLQQFPLELTADFDVYRYDPDRARSIMLRYKEVLGDRYYAEVHSNDFARYMDAVPRIMQLADDCGVPKVIANDAHYTVTEDAVIQRLLSKINHTKVDELGDQQSGPYYLKCRDEIVHPLFTADMYARTAEIADRCSLSLERTGYMFPQYQLDGDVDWSAYQQAGKAS